MEPSDAVQNVKTKIQDQKGIDTQRQHLIFSGFNLEDDARTLSQHKIQESMTVFLVLSDDADS